MIADKGWNSTLDPDTHARHGLSQELEHDLGFHVQEGKMAAFFPTLGNDSTGRRGMEIGEGHGV